MGEKMYDRPKFSELKYPLFIAYGEFGSTYIMEQGDDSRVFRFDHSLTGWQENVLRDIIDRANAYTELIKD